MNTCPKCETGKIFYGYDINVEDKYVLEDQVIGYYEDFDYNSVFSGDELNNMQYSLWGL